MRPTFSISLLWLVFSSVGTAAVIAPCTTAPGVVNIIPLTNATNTYCVSDYGWSDTWFVGTAPAVYDPRFDVLSGDDSPNLRFGILGGAAAGTGGSSGFGWISPTMDVGTLSPSVPTGSPWTVLTGVHGIGLGSAASLVHHPLGLDMLITTTLGATGEITQHFSITNTNLTATFTDSVLLITSTSIPTAPRARTR